MSEMESINTLGSGQLLSMLSSGARRVISNEARLNEINFFPVSDHDTGSNLASTMRYFLAQTYQESEVTNLLKAIANDILTGAYGNSGVILAAFFLGFASHETVNQTPNLHIHDFISRLQRGVEYAYQSVSKPTEGTILSVMSIWAKACHAHLQKSDNFIDLFSQTLPIVFEAVQDTKHQLKILDKNKIVDAGALGFFELISGMYDYLIHGESSIQNTDVIRSEPINHTYHHEFDAIYEYCAETIISTDKINLDQLKNELSTIGDSLVIANGLDCNKIHLHVNNPLAMTGILKKYGVIQHQKIDSMKMQREIAQNKKHSIAIVTDSSADIPASILKNNQIHILPLSVKLGDHVFLDRITINVEELLHGIHNDNLAASTSSPSPEMVHRNLNYLSKHHDAIIVFTLSSHLSATYQTIANAAKKIDHCPITVIDTRRNSAAHGLLILQTIKWISEGSTYPTIIDKINKTIHDTHIFVAINEIQTMVNHGRAPKFIGNIAKWSHLKPIVTLSHNGKPSIAGIGIGNKMSWKIISRIIKKLKKTYQNYTVMITHTGNRLLAENFATYIKKHAGVNIDHMTETSCIIALHAGKDCVAIAISKNMEPILTKDISC